MNYFQLSRLALFSSMIRTASSSFLQSIQHTLNGSTCKSLRMPYLWRKKDTVSESKAPRFEMNYILKTTDSHETNKERGKLKQLTRQLQREKKAAMRELRRDQAFLMIVPLKVLRGHGVKGELVVLAIEFHPKQL
jgi:hypothetical protein